MNFNRRGNFVSKRVKFEVIFTWPLIFYKQELCKIIIVFEELVYFDLWISGFRFLVSGFRFPGFRVAVKILTGRRQISWLFESVAGCVNNSCHQLVVRMGQKPIVSDLKSGALITRQT